MSVNFKDLGLVNTREMFKRAINGGWAVPAFNFNNLEQLQAIITASSKLKSPVILQVSKGARNYANATLLRYLAEGAVAYAKELGCNHPEIVLHLDHGDSFELCKNCVDMGFSSVMIDGSSLPYDENVALIDSAFYHGVAGDSSAESGLRSANEFAIEVECVAKKVLRRTWEAGLNARAERSQAQILGIFDVFYFDFVVHTHKITKKPGHFAVKVPRSFCVDIISL